MGTKKNQTQYAKNLDFINIQETLSLQSHKNSDTVIRLDHRIMR